MKKFHIKWCLSALITTSLCACVSLDTERPDTMYRQAIMHNLQKDNQYNFSANVTLNWEDKTAVSEPSTPLELENDVDATEAVAVSEADATWEEMADLVVLGAARYPVVNTFLKHSHVNMDGAVDLPKGKVELVPSLNVATGNYGMWAKLPMLVDAKNERILVDAQGYAGWLQTKVDGNPELNAQIQKLEQGALLEIKQPEESSERYPVKTAVKALPKALEAYLDAMDAKHFALVNVDDYGRSLHARYQVQLQYNYLDSLNWTEALLKGYQAEFARLRKEAPEANVSDKAYEQIESMVLLGSMLLSQNGATPKCETNEQGEEVCVQDEAAQKALAKASKAMPVLQHSLYLNASGRILGAQDRLVLQSRQTPKALVYTSKLKLFNHGRPQFTLDSAPRETVSVWRLAKHLKSDAVSED